jgi:sarcosine oxidase
MHAQDDFFGTTVRAAQRFGIAHELLDAADIRARFPRFAVDDAEHGYFEPGAGWLDPEACVAAHLHRARALGAGLRFGERVEHIEAAESAIAVHTTSETYHPKKLIVAAGAWLPALCPEFARQQLVVRRQVMLWFESTVSMPHEPVFIWHWGERESDVFYGFPGRDGAIKMAAETLTGSTPPDGVDRNVSEDEFAAFYQRHARDRMTGVTPKGVGAATCLYTVAPRANFVIDALPGCTNAVAVSACSGHGFKHSAAIGEAVAQWLCTGKRPEVLGPFALPQS